ncbi:MAG: 4Fe-4S dicluster domain-containing protein [Clostridia bacterium]|nr:4Fe-4S dicluster domain-containing protein [Clostridia bacterium]
MSIIQFKEANCKNCYKCLRSCPVKAIAFFKDQASILEEDCMLCGNCLTVCPQNAKSVKSDIDTVKEFIKKKEKVYVSLAPSYVAAFETSDERQIIASIKKLGFTYIEETAVGAVQVSKEYEKLLLEKKMKNIITTACPSISLLIQKYYPELVEQMAPVVSPMIAHAKMLRETYGNRIRVVFIGPCLSKKDECRDLQNSGAVDAVITFEELEQWLETEGIDLEMDSGDEIKGIKDLTARLYPIPGGIIKTIDSKSRKNYKCISVDGVDRCMRILDSIKNDGVENYFIEMNSCSGGCIGGPCMKPLKGGFLEARDRLIGYIKRGMKEERGLLDQNVKVDLSKKFFDMSKELRVPSESVIAAILNRIGKFNKDQELNCGACGYSSCREKAIAVFNNKAQLHMCLPYMRERAESISNLIINTTPNAIIALDTNLCIQEINLSAQKIFKLDKNMEGTSIYEILECEDFQNVLDSKTSIYDQKFYYEKYDITVEQTIIYVPEQNIVVVILKDITKEEKTRQQMYQVRAETVDIAQKVIEKQMRVAQEIASLLGETTAETKVALTKLKKSIMAEEGEVK